jgi:hypothetical protein
MPEILSCCGYRCDLCMAYRPNVETDPASRQVLSDGWFKYFGFRIPPEEILCDGCRAEGLQQIDPACPVRPCVMERCLSDCSECPDYGCAKLAERLVVFEDIAARTKGPIPDEDRARFIAPFENKRRLEERRTHRL